MSKIIKVLVTLHGQAVETREFSSYTSAHRFVNLKNADGFFAYIR